MVRVKHSYSHRKWSFTNHSPSALTSSFTDTPCNSGGTSLGRSCTVKCAKLRSAPFRRAADADDVRNNCCDAAGTQNIVESGRGRIAALELASSADGSIHPLAIPGVWENAGPAAAPSIGPNVGVIPIEAPAWPVIMVFIDLFKCHFRSLCIRIYVCNGTILQLAYLWRQMLIQVHFCFDQILQK